MTNPITKDDIFEIIKDLPRCSGVYLQRKYKLCYNEAKELEYRYKEYRILEFLNDWNPEDDIIFQIRFRFRVTEQEAKTILEKWKNSNKRLS